MDRRSFLTSGIGTTALATLAGSEALGAGAKSAAAHDWRHSPALHKALNPRPLGVTAGLEKYKPGEALGMNDARHLLQRACFQYSKADLEKAALMTADEALDHLLTGSGFDVPVAPDWADEKPLTRQELFELTKDMTPEEREEFQRQRNQQQLANGGELQAWWAKILMSSSFDNSSQGERPVYNALREKMTFFWHNHFTSELQVVRLPQYMYMQNAWQRENAFGNFRQLARESVTDPAMVVYLDSNTNVVGRPNENFAREILELFTMGEGNYTEFDIVEAARAFTGWQVSGLESTFVPLLHDFDAKTFMGETFRFERSPEGGVADTDKIIELIFAQTFAASGSPYDGKNITAVFLAKKLYRYFVYEHVDDTLVAAMADELLANNFDLAPVLKTLLTSAHFFDPEFRGAMIKNPLDLMFGMLHQVPMEGLPYEDEGSRRSLSGTFVGYAAALGLILLDPPNVAGWPGYREWINTVTFPQRNFYTDAMATGFQFGRPPARVGALAWQFANQFASFTTTVEEFVDEVAAFLLPFPLSDNQRADLVQQTLLGAPDYEWQNVAANEETANPRIQNLLREVMRLPEYQLA